MIKANLSWMDREVAQSLLSFLPSHNVCEHYLAPFFSFVLFYWNSSFFLLVLFDPFCFFFTRQQPLITLLLILYFKAFFKQIHSWDLWTLDKQIFSLFLAGERERKKGGSKEGEWEMGEALAARKQSWCCWFHWVYWERRAARVTSANNTELQSQEVCVCEYTCEAFVSLHLSFSSTFCWVLKDSKRDRK